MNSEFEQEHAERTEKSRFIFLCFLCCLLLNAFSSFTQVPPPALPAPQTVTLGWNYPVSELSLDLNFLVSQTTDLSTPFTNWTPLTNLASTNCAAATNGGRVAFTNQFAMLPGRMFFAVQASNFWGLSPTSNVIGTPAVAVNPTNVGITRP